MSERHPHHNPFEGVTDLFSELVRMREVGTHGRASGPEDRERTHASAWVPAADIFAQGGHLVIRVELPGVRPDDVDLRFANGVLTVSGTRSPGFGEAGEEPTFYVRERFSGEFRRSVALPEGTRRDQIRAEFDNGLVEIRIEGVAGRADATRIELRDRSGAATTRPVD
jgi:HSP20 family protein